ncbi:glycine cleavage H-protein, partial [Rhodotorula sp. JG-1b]
RYTPEHEWVSFDDSTGLGTIGITEYAQKALGDVVYVELPAEGTQVATGEEMGAVESVKAASDIFAPVSGQIEAVNGELADQPDLLNKDAEGAGWLAKIKLSNPGEFDQLLNGEAYKAHCEGESEASD